MIFLGNRISAEGIGTDPEKISVINSWAKPTTVKDLRICLGFCTYYRKFVKDYTTMTEPLNKLMRQMNEKEVKPVSRSKIKIIILEWNPGGERAMNRLMIVMSTPPILVSPYLGGEFVLETNTSNVGL